MNTTPLIGILECGQMPESMVSRHGTYLELYANLLGRDGIDYRNYAVWDGELPESTDAADGFVISGSRHGAYEDLPWIAPLEDFLRRAYDDGRALVGICFGHQILAQALGGTVEKFSGGWSVGPVNYQLDPLYGVESGTASLHAFHQDQVVQAPSGASVLGSSQNCRIAALGYNAHTVSLQPHPEFDADCESDLLRLRGDNVPVEMRKAALSAIGTSVDNAAVGAALRNILLSTPRRTVEESPT